jgi:hypothetical protein
MLRRFPAAVGRTRLTALPHAPDTFGTSEPLGTRISHDSNEQGLSGFPQERGERIQSRRCDLGSAAAGPSAFAWRMTVMTIRTEGVTGSAPCPYGLQIRDRRARGGQMRVRLPVDPFQLLALIVALDLIGASPVFAQMRISTLDELRRELSPGDVVSLVKTTGESVRGRLVRFADTALDIRSETRQVTGKQRLDVTVPYGTIRSLERPRDSSRNGVLVGAGIGAGVSLGMFIYAAAVDYNEIDEWGPIYLAMGAVYSGVGALVGWAIDSAHSKPHVRFNAPSAETMSIRVAPLLARRKGMVLVLSF